MNALPGGMINVTPTTLQVNENGGTGSFSVSLVGEPAGNVVIDLVSGDESEATVSPAQLTFTPDNFAAPQSATVTGVDDAEFDGTQSITIATNVTATGNYEGVDAADVAVDVLDDDEPGGSVSPTSVTVTEDGMTATFDVVLSAAPTGDVTIPISVSDDTEIAVDIASLTFTAADFGTAQTVTVSAIDDTEVESLQTLSVVVGAATGGGYDGFDLADVDVTVVDNDDPTVVVAPTLLTTNESGTTATFDVTLGAPPTDDVTIDAVVGDTTEGSVMPASLTLNAGSLTGQFTVTGLDDPDNDGDQTYQITLSATSNDAAYDGLPGIPAVAVTNRDNDTATVNVTPQMLIVDEDGATSATFTIALSSDPGETVTVDLTSSDVTEATVAPAQLSFDGTNFGTPQTVTVTAIDDAEADGNTSITINTVMNATAAYAGIDPANVNVQVLDDDAANVNITPFQGLTTTEAGGSATFDVVLGSRPTDNVTIDFVSSDTAEGTVSPASITFTPGTAQTAQTVTVTGVDDLAQDGNVAYNIVTTLTSADSAYAAINPQDVFVTNLDDDQAGFTVIPDPAGAPQRTSEDGTSVTFTVQLNTPPSDDVNIPIQVTDSTEGSVAPQNLTFTSADWSTPQTVTVTGLDDMLRDGPVQYTVVLDQTTSADSFYNQLDPPNVPIINNDNEAGFTVTPLDLTVSESGANNTATFSITLNSPPSQNVRIDLTPDGAEGDEYDVSPQQFVFTPQNWLTAQTATVTGVPDGVIDGAQTWSLDVGVGQTIDAAYASNCSAQCLPIQVDGTTTDSDQVGVTVSPTTFTVSEGECQTVDVTLNTLAVTNTSFTIELADTMTLGNNELRFANPTGGPTTLNRTINAGTTSTSFVVCGFQDSPGVAENQKTEVVTLTAFTTVGGMGDPYEGIDPADLNVTIEDDDTPSVIIQHEVPVSSDQNLWTTEFCAGATAADPPVCTTNFDQFTIRLATRPTTSVIVTITASDSSEALVSDSFFTNLGSSISFVFQQSDWNSPQGVVAIPVDDALLDGTQSWTLDFDVSSVDTFYDGISVDSIDGFTSDDDQPGWTYIQLNTQETSEAGGPGAVYSIINNTLPNAPIDVEVEIAATDEALIGGCGALGASCTVTGGGSGADVNIPAGSLGQVFFGMVGVDDNIIDGPQTWSVTQVPGALVTTDPDYISTTYPTASGINNDDDQPGVVINGLASDIEEDESDSFNVRLTSQPTADVTVTVSTSDNTEATISSGTTLVFNAANWNTNALNVDLDGVEDNAVDGDQDITVDVVAASTDVDFDGATASAPITIEDIDLGSLEFQVVPGPNVTTNESGTTSTIRVRLTSIPTANVTIPVYSFDTSEATVSVASLTFTPANWDVFQNVVVTGVDDNESDGNQNFTIWFDIPTSADPAYDGLAPTPFLGTNVDNDDVGVTVTQPTNPSILVTDEDGGADTFQVALNTQPTGTVTLVFGEIGGAACPNANNQQCVVNWPNGTAASGNGTISPGSVTFDSTNWSTARTITVTGDNNNNFADSVVYYRVPIVVDNTVMGRDTAYDGVFIDQVLGALIDNDDPALIAIGMPIGTTGAGPGLDHYVVTGENGSSGTFYVRATEVPTNPVTIDFTLDSVVTGPASIVLTQQNYNQLQEVTLTGVDDANIVDPNGLTLHSIDLDATSTDPDYNGVGLSLIGANADDDECVLWQLPLTGANDLIADSAPQVPVPFAFGVGADPPINPVQTFVNFGGSVVERDQNQTFSTGGVPSLFYAYGTAAGAFTVSHSVLLGDACYTNAAPITLDGTSL